MQTPTSSQMDRFLATGIVPDVEAAAIGVSLGAGLDQVIGARMLTPCGDVATYTPNSGRVGPYQYGARIQKKIQALPAGAVIYRHKVAFTNWYQNPGELDTTGGLITVTSSVLPVWGSAAMPVQHTFGGNPSVVIAAGQTAWSDWCYAILTPGSATEWRNTVAWTSAGVVYGQHSCVSSIGEGLEGGVTVTDKTMLAQAGGNITAVDSYAFGPSNIVGSVRGNASSQAQFVIVGDSIGRGSGDTIVNSVGVGDANGNYGWLERLIGGSGKYGVVNCSMSAKKLADFNTNNKRIIGLTAGVCNYAVLQLGTNDTGITLAQRQALFSAAFATLASVGFKVIATTLGTDTSSTDSWATLGNQTSVNSDYNVGGIVSQYNDWLRAGAGGVGLAGLLDFGDSIMSARNSMLWRIDLGQATVDGLHPSAVMHARVASDTAAKLAQIVGF